MARPATIKPRIARAIKRAASPVLLTRDFDEFGSRRQVLRVLRELEREKVIARIGHGVYARRRTSSLTGERILECSLPTLAREFAARVGAWVVPTDEEFALWQGRSTQVPVGAIIGVDRPISRRLRYGDPGGPGIRFEWIRDGAERMAALGVPYLYKRVAELA